MYKIMIVGHGFVGSAVASLFSEEVATTILFTNLQSFNLLIMCWINGIPHTSDKTLLGNLDDSSLPGTATKNLLILVI